MGDVVEGGEDRLVEVLFGDHGFPVRPLCVYFDSTGEKVSKPAPVQGNAVGRCVARGDSVAFKPGHKLFGDEASDRPGVTNSIQFDPTCELRLGVFHTDSSLL